MAVVLELRLVAPRGVASRPELLAVGKLACPSQTEPTSHQRWSPRLTPEWSRCRADHLHHAPGLGHGELARGTRGGQWSSRGLPARGQVRCSGRIA